jgi:threonine/homoserine/homoserine lactone efflux protein
MTLPVELATLLIFTPAALALNLTPGADMMFCLGQGLRAGPKAALAADAGIALGGMVHVLIAGLGLGAVMATHPALFDVIRWIGVAYLLWLAWQALRATTTPKPDTARRLSPARAFRDGLLVNLTNPKVILFTLAFIPQFVDPAHGPVLTQFLIFGAVLSVGGLIVNGAVGLSAGGLGTRLAASPRLARALGLASAGIFALLALRLAFLQKG